MWRRRLGVENGEDKESMSISFSYEDLLLLLMPRVRGDGLEDLVAFRDRVEGVERICTGLWRRLGFVIGRGDGAGDPLRSDWSARQVLRMPVPDGRSSSDGGGVVRRRLGVKHDRDDDRRMSHGNAEGSSIVAATMGR